MKRLLLVLSMLVVAAPCFAAVITNKSKGPVQFTSKDEQRTKEIAKGKKHECPRGGFITNTSDKDVKVITYVGGDKKNTTTEILAPEAKLAVAANDNVTVKCAKAGKADKKSVDKKSKAERRADKKEAKKIKTTRAARKEAKLGKTAAEPE